MDTFRLQIPPPLPKPKIVEPQIGAAGAGSAFRSITEFEFRGLREPRVERELCLITRQLRFISPNMQHFLDRFMKPVKSNAPVFKARIYYWR